MKKFRFMPIGLAAVLLSAGCLAPGERAEDLDDDGGAAREDGVSNEFSDVSYHWASVYILAVAKSSIVAGYKDGTFRPDKSVTRAELATILIKAYPCKPGPAPAFTDIQGHWAAKTIQSAAGCGYLSGDGNGKFRPNDGVTRQEAITALVSAIEKVAPGKLIQPPEALDDYFKDSDDVSKWATPDVVYATGSGLVSSYPDPELLMPRAVAKRGDICAFVYRAKVLTAGWAPRKTPFWINPNNPPPKD